MSNNNCQKLLYSYFSHYSWKFFRWILYGPSLDSALCVHQSKVQRSLEYDGSCSLKNCAEKLDKQSTWKMHTNSLISFQHWTQNSTLKKAFHKIFFSQMLSTKCLTYIQHSAKSHVRKGIVQFLCTKSLGIQKKFTKILFLLGSLPSKVYKCCMWGICYRDLIINLYNRKNIELPLKKSESRRQ